MMLRRWPNEAKVNYCYTAVVGGEYRQQGKAKLNGTLIEKERLHQKAHVWHGNVSNKEHTISEGIFM
jgi:hypothetical protein